MTRTLTGSYAWCDRLARREAGNFYHAFRLLPGPQRNAMSALYAFLRIADDLSDRPAPSTEKRGPLADWRRRFDLALEGRYTHRLHPALHHALGTFAIPRQYLDDVLDGVEMDLSPVSFATFADLYPYCYRVASAVGLCCIHVWGFANAEAKVYAEHAGIAFQLTNILRDLAEDAGRGRVYLPREDLDRFGYTEDHLRAGLRNDRFRDLMRFEVERTRGFYTAARPLSPLLPPAGRAIFQVMAKTYEGLLNGIERRQYDVFSARVRLSRWHKLTVAARAWPVRWGWL